MVPSDKRIVLLAEDDTFLLESMVSILESAGYAVVTATNGLEALRYLDASSAPDLILLDLRMPVMDGLQFLREQRARPALAQIPVVLYSAEPGLRRLASELAVAGYLHKSDDRDRVLATLLKLVGSDGPS